MVNVFGSIGEEESPGNNQVARKVIAISGMFGDYFNEIQASHKLVYSAYRKHLMALQLFYLHMITRFFAW